MSRLVDGIWIRQRMDGLDLRYQAEARRKAYAAARTAAWYDAGCPPVLLEALDVAIGENPHAVCRCGVPADAHVDGWDGNRLDCDEARRRHGAK